MMPNPVCVAMLSTVMALAVSERLNECVLSESGLYLTQESGAGHYRFKELSESRVPRKGALAASFERYRSEDGVLVTRSTETYKSATAANTRIARLRNKAEKLVERGAKTSYDGRRVGERIVVLLRSGKTAHAQAVVAWTDGREATILASESIQHVLDFEQQVYPAVPRPAAVTGTSRP